MVRGQDVIVAGCRNSASTESRFYAFRIATGGYSPGYGWGKWISLWNAPTLKPSTTFTNYLNDRLARVETVTYDNIEPLDFVPTQSIYLFATNSAGTATHRAAVRIYDAEITEGTSQVSSFVPALAPSGEPCMYDKITKQSFYNSNEGSSSFIIGVDTKIQLRTIVQSLPDNTDNYIENEDGTQTPVVKTLVISIPADWLGEGDIDSWLSGDFGQEIQQYATDINWTLQFNTH